MTRRYPFDNLAAAAGMTPNALARQLGISGSTWKDYRENGMSELVADRRAVQCGFVAWQVWPEMLEHAQEDERRAAAARAERKKEVQRAWYRRNAERLRAERRERYAREREAERRINRKRYQHEREQRLAYERARYWSDPERHRQRQRDRRAQRREAA